MKSVPFTQYLRPHGHTRETSFELPDDLHAKAMQIIEAGYCFECEELSNGFVSLTISNGEEDVAIEVIPNGPKVPPAVHRLITNFETP